MEIFKVEKLGFRFPEYETGTYSKQPDILKEVSFTIEKGDFVTLAGPTGCGKSTLLRLLKKELAPRGEQTGKIYYLGKELSSYQEGSLASQIGFVMQSPTHQYVTDKVWHELAFGLENMGMDRQQMRFRLAEMASYFGMDHWLEEEVYTLSGGQKQLLNLASVLIMCPEILILDEPTSQLDPIAAENFIHTIKKLNEETGITILIAEHRLESVLPISDKVLFMQKGQVVYEGTPGDIKPDTTYYEEFRLGLPCSMRLFMEFYEKKNQETCPLTVAEGKRFLHTYFHNTQKVLKKTKNCSLVNKKKAPCLEVKSVWFKYQKKGADVLKETSFTLYEGEIFCILGANGSGKSTALKCVAGILKPYAGKVKKVEKRIGYLPQDVETVFVTDRVEDDLKLVGYDKATREYPFDLTPYYDKHPYDLSGGEKQLVAIAKILARGADILLLDEPAKGLDANAKARLLDLLEILKSQGKAILVVTHDVEFAALCGDRCALFSRGEIVCETQESSFFTQNTFYTTAASRISRDYYDGVVTTSDLIMLCKENGGIL